VPPFAPPVFQFEDATSSEGGLSPWQAGPGSTNVAAAPWHVSGAAPTSEAASLPWEAPGYPAPVRSPDVPPLPGPGEWPSQQRRSRRPLLFVLIGVIVLVLVGAGIVVALTLSS
jgi:hypothetical protein